VTVSQPGQSYCCAEALKSYYKWQPLVGRVQSIAFADGANSDAQALGIGDIAAVINTGNAFDQAISGGSAAVPFSATTSP
jgi:hypothetical protein